MFKVIRLHDFTSGVSVVRKKWCRDWALRCSKTYKLLEYVWTNKIGWEAKLRNEPGVRRTTRRRICVLRTTRWSSMSNAVPLSGRKRTETWPLALTMWGWFIILIRGILMEWYRYQTLLEWVQERIKGEDTKNSWEDFCAHKKISRGVFA